MPQKENIQQLFKMLWNNLFV